MTYKDLNKEDLEELYINQKLSSIKIGKLYGFNSTYILKALKYHNIPRRNNKENSKKYYYNENYFEKIDNEHKAYWLGFLYADGYIVSKRKHSSMKLGVSLSIKDKIVLENLNKDLESNNKISVYKTVNGYKEGNKYCRVLYTGDKICNDLIDKGCFLNKTLILKFPTEEQVPEHLIRHFIRGYIDGDGSIVTYKYKNGYTTSKISICGTKEFLEGIKEFFKITHIKLNRKKDCKVNTYNLTIGGNSQVKEKLDIIYNNSTIYLERKHKKYIEIKQI